MPASNYLVGTAPDQVPSNADLGEMAFQSKDAVEFTGGKGGLSHLDITAISAQLNVSATDVFVYDTSKDSDGGAWRNRCQHTSWFNEELNTATRGERREFPSVAVIVAGYDLVRIYDGDDPSLPLWMAFTWSTYSLIDMNGGRGANAVHALNGYLAWASTVGVKYANFIKDSYGTYGGDFTYLDLPSIEKRNSNVSAEWSARFSNAIRILNNWTTDISMAVLPDAVVDPATGLPVPTIGIAMPSGLSFVHSNQSVTSRQENQASMDTIRVLFTGNQDEYIYVHSWGGGTHDVRMVLVEAGRIKETVALDYPRNYQSWEHPTSDFFWINGLLSNATGTIGPIYSNPVDTISGATSVSNKAAGNIYGLTQFWDKSVAYSTSKFATGWLPFLTRGAWLSDTTQETVIGSNIFPNQDFSGASGTTPPTGWSSTGASYSASGGVLSVTCGANSNTVFSIGVSGLIVGRQYTLSLDVSSGDAYWRVIVESGLVDVVRNISTSARTTQVYTVLAQSSSINIYGFFGSGGVSGSIANVSLRLADSDRSVGYSGLQVFGSITKTPVAAGADLVAYSGFSASNYLYRPNSGLLDFGTGDLCMMAWVKGAQNRYGHVLSIAGLSDGQTTSGTIHIKVGPDNAAYVLAGSASIGASRNVSTWMQICAVRRNGVVSVYFDGVLNASAAYAASISGKNVRVGNAASNDTPNEYVEASVALVRVAATAPSDAQIRRMYEDEKHLFQDNAKATLYGTSDAVTALAYDEDTQLLHVGTSSGRSVFDGLRRVDNTTTAVSATISAANGLVVEN
jgi:hypothetical protein